MRWVTFELFINFSIKSNYNYNNLLWIHKEKNIYINFDLKNKIKGRVKM